MGGDKVEPGEPDSQAAGSRFDDLASVITPDSPIDLYLRWARVEHGAPEIYHFATILAIASQELARRGFRIQRGVLSLWFALIGESAQGKSSAISMGEQFIHDAWRDAGLEFEPDPWLEAEGSIAGLLASIREHYDEGRDTTTCMLFQHEFASLFQTREAMSEMLCRIADGHSYQRHLRELQRKKDRPDKIIHPVVSGLFATTEAALAPHFKEAQRSGGLFSRLAWVKPRFSPGQLRLERDRDAATQKLRDRAIDAWTAWFAQLGILLDACGGTLTVEPAAYDLLEAELFEPVRKDCAEGDDANGIRLRTVERARVTAAIFAAQRVDDVVRIEDMRRAVAWSQILLRHAAHISVGAAESHRLSQRLEKVIRTQGDAGANLRLLYSRTRTDKRLLQAALDILLDQGFIVEDRGRKSGVQFYVHADTVRGRQLSAPEKPGSGEVVDLTPAGRPSASRKR